MPHIFISYAKKDTRELALALQGALNALDGVTAWADASLRAGGNWDTQIQTEINRCDYFVVLYSPDINRHLGGDDESYVLDEIAYAKFTAKKQIIPVMAQRTEPPMNLTRTQYVDFTLPGLRFDDLVKAICNEIGVEGSAPSKLVAIDEFAAAVRQNIGDPFEWCEVPAGPFLMGSDRKKDKLAFDDEPDLHQVTLPGFFIAKYPITYAQFQAFVSAHDGIIDDRWWVVLAEEHREPFEQEWKFDSHPRENVNWYQAMAFCHWLSHRILSVWKPPVAPNYYPTDPFTWPIRLPTEAEWEKAARGTNGWIYSWGDAYQVGYANIDESGMIGGERQSKTTSVINYVAGASPFGVVDMIGNVMEWCLSEWTDPYHHEVAQAGRIRTKVSRAVRSGSWKTGYTISRAAIRDSWNPVALDNDLGFRVCVSFPMSVDYIPPN